MSNASLDIGDTMMSNAAKSSPGPARCQPHQAELFPSLPDRPYCTNDLRDGVARSPAGEALGYRYLQINPLAMRAYLVFDVDREGAGAAWVDAGLPPPWWTAVNPKNRHAHLCYRLAAPVCLTANARRRPVWYLAAIEQAMTHALGADRYYAGLITKNPAHPHWWTVRGPGRAYDLGDLAEYVNLDLKGPIKKPPGPAMGPLWRNVDTFEHVRALAYRTVLKVKREDHSLGEFVTYLADQAHAYQSVFEAGPKGALGTGEIRHIATSVARWTWAHFSDEAFSAVQAARGRAGGIKSGQVRAAGNAHRDAIICQYYEAEGGSVRALAREFGLPLSTIRRSLKRGLNIIE